VSGERIILCLNCGQQNRLKAEGRVHMARCGRCSEPLAVPTNGRKRTHAFGLITVLLVATAGVVGYFVHGDQQRSPNTGAGSKQAKLEPSISEPEESLPEVPIVPIPELKPPPSFSELNVPPVAISTGLVRTRHGGERIAPIEIRTSSGTNYFLKLDNAADGREELAMYIQGGRTFTSKVPLGTYELRYCAGSVWYGEPYRFGPDMTCYRAEKQFTFYRRGNTVNGYTIELILQVGGNLRTTRIDPSQF
jgi:hypothetical protein